MSYFKEMIQIAKRDGIVGQKNNSDFLEACLRNAPFVFLPVKKKEGSKDIILEDDCWEGFKEETLDAPFETFSIETDGHALTYPARKDWMTMDHNVLYCIMVNEIAPFEYEYWFLITDQGERVVGYAGRNVEEAMVKWCGFVVQEKMKQLSHCKDGIREADISTSIRRSGEKKKTRINKTMIHVISPNTSWHKSKAGIESGIEWDHSWSVRGHWMHLQNKETIGKDRHGNRQDFLKGVTWRGSHVKGDSAFIPKERIVRKK